LQFAQQPVLPSWWLSSGLLEAAHPAARFGRTSWQESTGFLAVLVSNALLLYQVAGSAGRRWFTVGYSEMVEIGGSNQEYLSKGSNPIAAATLWPVPATVRVVFLKDLRIFFRDILQWSQFAIFAGLLAIYFLNIRRLGNGAQYTGWLVLVGFLNIGVVGLLWATFTTRFVYPLLSLEGRRLWILGTAPVHRSTILWSKFLFATSLGLVPCSLLILLSDWMLGIANIGSWLMVLHQITSVCLCLGLAGIAVGLGAWLPNLHETAPAKIATGYGGTLTLVLSVLFIIASVLATALPVWGWSQGSTAWQPAWMGQSWFKHLGTASGLTTGIVITLVLGVVATWLPLQIGLRAFERIEL
jgi:ABC-2 type transport system permease protein